jgi:CO/xanthine dehydrogenase FAD-binding subunit
MATLVYAAPRTVDEAVQQMSRANGAARVLSGGTDLLVQLQSGRVKPGMIVDVKRIPGLIGIRAEGGGFVIGAATPCALIGEHADLKAVWPGVVEAACLIGSTQVQGRASLAGNLCNASPAADSVPALIAARATCTIAGPTGSREAPVEAITTGPGQTSLARGELIVAFRLPARPARAADAYLRFIPRTEMDIAVVGAAVNLVLDARGLCTDARVVLGAVAPTACASLRPPPAEPAGRSATNEGRPSFALGSRASWHGGPPAWPSSAHGSGNEQTSRFDHDQRRTRRVPLRDAADPARRPAGRAPPHGQQGRVRLG